MGGWGVIFSIWVGLWVTNLNLYGFFLTRNIMISRGPEMSITDYPLNQSKYLFIRDSYLSV